MEAILRMRSTNHVSGTDRVVKWPMQTADGGKYVCLFGIHCKKEEEEKEE